MTEEGQPKAAEVALDYASEFLESTVLLAAAAQNSAPEATELLEIIEPGLVGVTAAAGLILAAGVGTEEGGFSGAMEKVDEQGEAVLAGILTQRIVTAAAAGLAVETGPVVDIVIASGLGLAFGYSEEQLYPYEVTSLSAMSNALTR